MATQSVQRFVSGSDLRSAGLPKQTANWRIPGLSLFSAGIMCEPLHVPGTYVWGLGELSHLHSFNSSCMPLDSASLLFIQIASERHYGGSGGMPL